MSKIHSDSVVARLIAQPRSDVIPGYLLPPKTPRGEMEAERLISQEHRSEAAAAAKAAGCNSDAIAAISSQSAIDAAQRARLLGCFTSFGRIATLAACLRQNATDKDRVNFTIDFVSKLSGEIDAAVLEDFCLWYWRMGQYAIPKELPATTPAQTPKDSASPSPK